MVAKRSWRRGDLAVLMGIGGPFENKDSGSLHGSTQGGKRQMANRCRGESANQDASE